MAGWQELEQTVRNMEDRYEKVKLRMTYSERSDMERDINRVKEVAHKERDKYVRWLWGY